jgi:Lysophospholipase catalytic domain
MTPMEFGSYDPDLSAMVNMSFAGTNLTNGKPDNGSSCVTGFDQAGFVMGTSSALFRVRQCLWAYKYTPIKAFAAIAKQRENHSRRIQFWRHKWNSVHVGPAAQECHYTG